MNKAILRLAVPNIIANITIPLLGMCDSAIAGHLPSALYIGAVAVAAVIFNFIYWNFSFLRLGTGGFTAQAFGKGDEKETVFILMRALLTAFCAAAVLLICQSLIFKAAFWFIHASPETKTLTKEYFFIYIWSAPFALAMFAFTGWFTGMQNAKAPMVISICANIVNILCSLLFVFGFKMQIKGIALGSLAAQVFGFLLALWIWFKYYGWLKKYLCWDFLKAKGAFSSFFKVNRDIFLRSAGIIAVTVFFTSASAAFGDDYLAANSLLLQFFLFFSYLMDGFAFAAEALSGKYYGAKDYTGLGKSIRYIFVWGIVLSSVFTVVYAFFTAPVLGLLTDKAEVIVQALHFKYWAVFVPFAGFAAFLWDGVFVGITAAKEMRNSMLTAAALFFALYFSLSPRFGNNALWFAFICYLLMRGLMQCFLYSRLKKRF